MSNAIRNVVTQGNYYLLPTTYDLTPSSSLAPSHHFVVPSPYKQGESAIRINTPHGLLPTTFYLLPSTSSLLPTT